MSTHARQRQARSRRILAVLALSLTATAVAACTSGTAGRQVAHLPGHAAGSPAAPQLTEAQSDRDMVDFAHCMRARGVQMPDPIHRAGHAGLSIELPAPCFRQRGSRLVSPRWWPYSGSRPPAGLS